MIHITPKAAQQILHLVTEKKSSESEGLRLAIEQGGCAGLQYVMSLTSRQSGDEVVESEGASVFIEAKSIEQLADCTIDYEEGLTGSGFRIVNPRAAGSCGCGTSFEPLSHSNGD